MIQLMYVSQHKSLSFDEAQQILNNSFSKNKKLDITGALVYVRGYFIQCIEGDAAIMEALFERIKRDTRHENVVTIAKDSIEKRFFDGWSMSLVNERGYNSVVKKYCDDDTFNPYFIDKQILLQLIKEISNVM